MTLDLTVDDVRILRDFETQIQDLGSEIHHTRTPGALAAEQRRNPAPQFLPSAAQHFERKARLQPPNLWSYAWSGPGERWITFSAT